MLTPPQRLGPMKRLKALGAWLNELRDYAAALNPMSSHNVDVLHTALGTSHVGTAEAPSQPDPPKPYLLTAIKDNHLLCQPMILNDAGTDLEPDADADAAYIAKPPGLWVKGWDGETVDGITYQFLDDLSIGVIDSTKRTATTNIPAVVENQRITPYYLENFSILYAVKISPMGLSVETSPAVGATPAVTEDITLIDLNLDGRAWAAV